MKKPSSPSPEVVALALKLKGALCMALGMLIYCPDYMHGAPKTQYKKRISKALELLLKQYPELAKIEIISVAELMEKHKDNFYNL